MDAYCSVCGKQRIICMCSDDEDAAMPVEDEATEQKRSAANPETADAPEPPGSASDPDIRARTLASNILVESAKLVRDHNGEEWTIDRDYEGASILCAQAIDSALAAERKVCIETALRMAADRAETNGDSKPGEIIGVEGDTRSFVAGMSEAMRRIYRAIRAITPESVLAELERGRRER